MSLIVKLENPVLKRELKVRIRIVKVISAIALRCVCLGLLFILVLLSRLGSGLLAFILAEVLLILLFTPGTVYYAFASSANRADFRHLALTRLSSGTILTGKLAGANLYTFMIIIVSAFAMCGVSLSHRHLHIWRLICANLALLILMLASTAIGLGFSVLFRRSIAVPAILAYIIIFLLIGSIVIPGPLIERMRGTVKATAIRVTLYTSPLIMTSRALGRIDIMRTRYMYNLADPIVDYGFTYPDWYRAGIAYIGISCILLIPTFMGFRRFILLPQ